MASCRRVFEVLSVPSQPNGSKLGTNLNAAAAAAPSATAAELERGNFGTPCSGQARARAARGTSGKGGGGKCGGGRGAAHGGRVAVRTGRSRDRVTHSSSISTAMKMVVRTSRALS